MKARHRHGHGIHSPFLFRLITEVMENKGNFSAWPLLRGADENVRNMLKILDMKSYHAGGIPEKGYSSREIKRMHMLPERFDRLLFRLVNEFCPKGITFYGSTFGVTLLALAMADRRITVSAQVENDHYRSFCRRLAEVYEAENLNISGSGNLVPADFVVIQHPLDPLFCDRLISDILMESGYGGVIVLCGIHHSDKMEEIWNRYKVSQTVRISLDIFEMGILICRQGLQKEDFVLRF